LNYKNVVAGIFISRPNRFIANVLVDGVIHVVHVRNTSRCKELLMEGVRVILEASDNPNRKTAFSLIAVYKNNRLLNIDSQAPNKVCHEGLVSGRIRLPGMGWPLDHIKAEAVYGQSRFDFYLESADPQTGEQRKAFVEVKGVTLEENNIVRFPDAPTERGLKHVNELRKALSEGYYSYIVLIIQMKDVLYFEPNDEMHPAFGQALRAASTEGVQILAYDCNVKVDELTVRAPVDVHL
jgi:sugar fermentation stimulation protein A